MFLGAYGDQSQMILDAVERSAKNILELREMPQKADPRYPLAMFADNDMTQPFAP